MNPVDKTNLFRNTPHPTQHHSFFRNLALVGPSGVQIGFVIATVDFFFQRNDAELSRKEYRQRGRIQNILQTVFSYYTDCYTERQLTWTQATISRKSSLASTLMSANSVVKVCINVIAMASFLTFIDIYNIYMLFAGLGSVRIVKNCDRGLENAASPRSQFITIRTDPKPVNNLFILFQALKRKKKNSRKKKTSRKLYCNRTRGQR